MVCGGVPARRDGVAGLGASLRQGQACGVLDLGRERAEWRLHVRPASGGAMEAAAGIWAGLGSGEAVWELRCGEVCCTWGRDERGRPTLSTGERRETQGRPPPRQAARAASAPARLPPHRCPPAAGPVRRWGPPAGCAPLPLHHDAAASRCEWSRSKQREWEEELCVLDKGSIVFFFFCKKFLALLLSSNSRC